MSSTQLARALLKLGCSPCDRHASGTHQEWERKIGGRTERRPIVMGKKDVSHKWLLRVLKAFAISKDELRRAL